MTGDDRTIRTGDYGDFPDPAQQTGVDRDNRLNYYVTICRYCGGSCASAEVCPRVKRIKYRRNGTIKRVWLRSKPVPSSAPNWFWTEPKPTWTPTITYQSSAASVNGPN
jgi:hypothetical protein